MMWCVCDVPSFFVSFLFFYFVGPAHHFLLHLEVSPLDKSAELEVALKTNNVGKGQRFRMWVPQLFFFSIWAGPSYQTVASTDVQLELEVLSIVTVTSHHCAFKAASLFFLCPLQAERQHSVPQGALTSRDAVRDPLHRAEKHRLSLLQAVQRPR